MSFRKAFLILGLTVLAIAAIGYALQGRIALPENTLEYLAIVGFIFASISILKDSVEFVQGMFSPHEQKTVDLPPIDPDRYVQIRRAALQNLRSSWVEGVFEKSLHQGIWLHLGLTTQPHAISRRTLRTNEQETPIAADKSIETVFNAAGRKLLILGDPGSGKTMQLLQLAKVLIATAENDPTAPLPFFLNLSSWAHKRESFTAWLAEELHQEYKFSRQFARQLIATKPLVLLLDGLDEVAAEHRPACVSGINTFLANHDIDLVVCSRLKEYDSLTDKLNLSSAVRISPLTDDQISSFLNHPGLELQAVRATLAQDSTLHELAQTPLMLYIMAVAYAGLTPTQLGQLNTTEARRRHIFRRYVDRVLSHRRFDTNRYTQEQAVHWVSQIASGLINQKLSTVYIEYLQPTWLPLHSQEYKYTPFGVIKRIQLTEKIVWLPNKFFLRFRIAIILALILSFFLWGVEGWKPEDFLTFTISGLIAGLYFGLVAGLTWSKNWPQIQTVHERLDPNQGIVASLNNSLKVMLIYCLIFMPLLD